MYPARAISASVRFSAWAQTACPPYGGLWPMDCHRYALRSERFSEFLCVAPFDYRAAIGTFAACRDAVFINAIPVAKNQRGPAAVS